MFESHHALRERWNRVRRRITTLTVVALVLALAGAGCIALGVRRLSSRVAASAVVNSLATTSLDEVGRSLRADLARAVRPAMDRTQKIAADPDVIAAIRAQNRERQTQACNDAIANATEIDAVALFDRTGKILAINTNYASGRPIPRDRIDRILGKSFAGREIIQGCVRNTADERVLEFQTHCDITPTLFDSSGLSIAYSVPVRDPATHAKIGVVSTRMRFERLTDLLKSRSIGGKQNVIEFVTDQGGYFSEKINRGQVAAPVPTSVLARMVEPLAQGVTDYCFTRSGRYYLMLFRLRDFATVAGGGIQVMILADEAWLAHEAREARTASATGIIAAGLLVLLLGALVYGIAMLRKAQRRSASN